jgi:hypothetical protein
MSRRFLELVVHARRLVTRAPSAPRGKSPRARATGRRQIGDELTQFSFRLAFMIDLAYVGVGVLGGAAVGRASVSSAPAAVAPPAVSCPAYSIATPPSNDATMVPNDTTPMAATPIDTRTPLSGR